MSKSGGCRGSWEFSLSRTEPSVLRKPGMGRTGSLQVMHHWACGQSTQGHTAVPASRVGCRRVCLVDHHGCLQWAWGVCVSGKGGWLCSVGAM